MQRSALFIGSTVIQLEFPESNIEVIPGVQWGAIDAFPSPAYWAHQVFARRLHRNPINYRIGETLREEVGACILGGHGIPAKIGLAAFRHLRKRGAFEDSPPSQDDLLQWLSESLTVDGRLVRYRFARQKAKYLSGSLCKLTDSEPPVSSGRVLRNWLLGFPGIGYKTASWIARNWLCADDVAILDIHVFRAGVLGGFFDSNLSIQKHYQILENQFVNLSSGLGVKASELDAVIWHEMMTSPATVHRAWRSIKQPALDQDSCKALSRTQQCHTNADQLPLGI